MNNTKPDQHLGEDKKRQKSGEDNVPPDREAV
jgi:hypothetical protein